MRRPKCWVIENYEYRPCPRPGQAFRSLISIHNHSKYSTENLASLNEVAALSYMRPFRGVLQSSFGLGGVEDLDYADVRYHPPQTPEDVLRVETKAVRGLGFEAVQVAITDHDEIGGGLELLARLPGAATCVALGEELSFRFDGHLFHLGLTGLPASGASETHAKLQAASQERRLDDLFELLQASGCLVVLNHPLLPWKSNPGARIPVEGLLKRYGWAIHALEFNGMRRSRENTAVLDLARHFGKPVVGGGDSHMLAPSSVLCGSGAARSFAEFIEEVKTGRAVPLVKTEYFAPLRYKLFLRTLCFIAHYRQIAHFRGRPVREVIGPRTVLLDPVGWAARGFLGAAALLGGVR